MTIPEIINHVASKMGVSPEQIYSRKRQRQIVWAKFIATREISREFRSLTLYQIRDAMRLPDHTTVLYRLNQAEWLIATNEHFRNLSRRIWE